MPKAFEPFEVLEAEAHRVHAEERAEKIIAETRVRLCMDKNPTSVFFSSLAYRAKLIADWEIPTACTDGRDIWYNPDFVCGLVPEGDNKGRKGVGLFLHELMHVIWKHATRRQARDPKLWNLACDGIINPEVKGWGYELPDGGFFPSSVGLRDDDWLSAEELYTELLKLKNGEGDGNDKGRQKLNKMLENGDDPGVCGGIKDPDDPSESNITEIEQSADIGTAQAEELARMAGDLPGSLKKFLKAATKEKVDWKSFLAQFLSQRAKEDYRIVPPNRRYISAGLALPTIDGLSVGTVLALFDTSGSMCSHIQLIVNELQGLLMAYECKLIIGYHDTQIAHVQEWQPGDGELIAEPAGFGGTCHIQPLQWAKDQEYDDLACVIAFTDLYSSFPPESDIPDAPLIWMTMPRCGQPPAYGFHFEVDEW